jgi:hypothetical protein
LRRNGAYVDGLIAPHRHQITSLLAVLVLCGCVGHSEPPVTEGRTTVGTLSNETSSNAIVQDITAVRTASDSGQADEALMAIYDLVQEASAQEVDQGAETLRSELPGLVAQLNAAAPVALARLSALELQTDGGKRFRDVLMKLLRGQTKSSNDLNEDVATSGPTREALVQWEEKTRRSQIAWEPKLRLS